MNSRLTRIVAIGLAVVTAVGHIQRASGIDFDLRKRIPWGEGKNGKLQPPMRVTPFWTEAVLNRANETGVRGFGGRLLFYGKDPKKTVKVSGSLVVYAFDEEGRSPTNVKPDRKYVFKAEDFEKTHAENEIGHSYNVWIPWDEVGGPQKEISLIARFTSDKGEVVVSEQQKQRLTGVPRDPQPQPSVLPQLGASQPGLLNQPSAQPVLAAQSGMPGQPGAMSLPSVQAANYQQPMVGAGAGSSYGGGGVNGGVMQASAVQAGVTQPTQEQLYAAWQAQQALAQQAMAGQQVDASGTNRRMEITTIPMSPLAVARLRNAGGQPPATLPPMQASPMNGLPQQGFPQQMPPQTAPQQWTPQQASPQQAFPVQQAGVAGTTTAGNFGQSQFTPSPARAGMPQSAMHSMPQIGQGMGGAWSSSQFGGTNPTYTPAGMPTSSGMSPQGLNLPGAARNAGPTGQSAASFGPGSATNGLSRMGTGAPAQPSAHFSPQTLPAQAWQSGQPSLGPTQWQQFPATQQFGHPSGPAQVQ